MRVECNVEIISQLEVGGGGTHSLVGEPSLLFLPVWSELNLISFIFYSLSLCSNAEDEEDREDCDGDMESWSSQECGGVMSCLLVGCSPTE